MTQNEPLQLVTLLKYKEDIFEVAKGLVRHLSDFATVLAAVRLKGEVNGKPGLVKISFKSDEEKI